MDKKRAGIEESNRKEVGKKERSDEVERKSHSLLWLSLHLKGLSQF